MDAAARPDWLKVTCRSVPTQIEGTSPDGEHVYFRYRWGHATLDVDDVQIWCESYGHDLSGDMDPDLAIALITAQLAARAAHRAARAALPVGDVPPLAPEEQALMDRWTATVPPTQD